MIKKRVVGSIEQSIPLLIGIDTVYVHNNIQTKESTNEEGFVSTFYEYDETQYTKDEYLQLMADKQRTESELTTQIDMDVQSLALKQNTESELITQHDIDIFGLISKIANLERRVEELEGWN